MKQEVNGPGNWALVAGAAEGLGAGFCEVLARQGWNLVMVDMNRDALRNEASKLSECFGILIREIHLDLASQSAAHTCLEAIHDIDCHLLVYVAAFCKIGIFTDLSDTELDRHLQVNNRTLLHLVHGFAQQLIAKNMQGNVLLVSSLAGLFGPKYIATYAATKSFIIKLGDALFDELRQQGINLSVCCAGTIDTPQFRRSAPRTTGMRSNIMRPEEVATRALKKMHHRSFYIPGWRNRFHYLLMQRFLPRRISLIIVNREIERMYPASSLK